MSTFNVGANAGANMNCHVVSPQLPDGDTIKEAVQQMAAQAALKETLMDSIAQPGGNLVQFEASPEMQSNPTAAGAGPDAAMPQNPLEIIGNALKAIMQTLSTLMSQGQDALPTGTSESPGTADNDKHERALMANFSEFDQAFNGGEGNGLIGPNDLMTIANDPSRPPELREAAQYTLDYKIQSPDDRIGFSPEGGLQIFPG